jgi:hypothetical protein
MNYLSYHARMLCALLILGNLAIPTRATAPQPTEIDSPLLKAMDGIINIKPLMKLVAFLQDVNYGTGPAKQGIIDYKGEKYTLKKLVEIERTLTSPSKQEASTLKKALDNAIAHVQRGVQEFKNYASEPDMKTKMEAIVKRWSEQKNRKHTVLPHWLKMEETDFITRHITSCKALSTFMEDLMMLMIDVKHTCKKSWKKYTEQQALKKAQHTV